MRIFEETQRFTQWWLWTLMLIILATVVYVPLAEFVNGDDTSSIGMNKGLWIGLAAVTLAILFLLSCKLQTRIDEKGVTYRFFPFQRKERDISWLDIENINVRTYKPIAEYGGWGYRLGRKGKALNVRGNQGIQITFKNGDSLLLGTQKPTDAAMVIKHYKNERV